METQITYEEYKNALKIVHAYKMQVIEHLEMIEREFKDKPIKNERIDKYTKLSDIKKNGMSIRLYNTLRLNADTLDIEWSEDIKLIDLSHIKLIKLKMLPNVGLNTCTEFRLLLASVGIKVLDK